MWDRIKNLLMQLLIITPLNLTIGIIGVGAYSPILLLIFGSSSGDNGANSSPSEGGSLIFGFLLMLVILFWLSKLVLTIRGKKVSFEYWDDDFKIELVHEYENIYSWRKIKGGWTVGTTFIVFFYMIISPLQLILQPITLLMAIVSLFVKRIFSYYKTMNLDGLSLSFLQGILHFFLGFVILV